MRVVLDTNVLVSALIVPGGPPERIYNAWRDGRFVLVTSAEQLDEFRRVTRYPRVRRYVSGSTAGAMLNELRQISEVVSNPPLLAVSPDPADNFLVALAVAARADFLVTGDRAGLLSMGRHGRLRIVTARQFAGLVR